MTYLIRVNLDIDDKNIVGNVRFQNTLKGIRSVTQKNNKVVILAHRGRPSKVDLKLSLKPFVAPLSKGLGKKVIFVKHFDFVAIAEQVEQSPNGTIFLLENLRFLPGEYKASKTLAESLAILGDKFINDDFPTSHHKNASNFSLPKLIPSSIGPNFKEELSRLNRVMRNPRRPVVLIIGGAKILDKLGVLGKFAGKANNILLGGGPANTVLKVRGINIGKSLYDPKAIQKIGPLANSDKVVVPIDWRAKNGAILDIGPHTIGLYAAAIKEAGTVIWNGPMGKCEDKSFSTGTKALYKAILAQKRANIVVGGGDTIKAISPIRGLGKNVFISSGGGAMLTYLSGEKLPALEALR